MRWILACVLSTVVVGPAIHEQAAPAGLDPVGKWTFATRDDQGQSISGTMTITGTPGHYSGSVVVQGQEKQPVVTDIVAYGNTMIVLANTGDGGAAVVKIWKGADGKHQAVWGPVQQIIDVKIEYSK